MGLLTAAVVALGGYLLWASGAVGRALDWLKDRFNALKDDAVKAFGGIKDALMAGDIGLAAKIFWLTLKLEWERGTAPLREVWQNIVDGMRAEWEIAVNGLAQTFIWLTNKLETLWAQFGARWKRTTIRLGDWMAKQWVDIAGSWSGDVPGGRPVPEGLHRQAAPRPTSPPSTPRRRTAHRRPGGRAQGGRQSC